jgi:SAM-dependent methyltransferase
VFALSAEYYDALYSFKDYAGEAKVLAERIRRENPGARTVLDVACGTGEHARHLAGRFAVDGIDLEPALVRIARAKNPEREFLVADMRSFDLERKYDAVTCLFGSIGYLLSESDTVAAMMRFRAHLAPGGVLMVEPFLEPQAFRAGTQHMLVADRPEFKICRMNVSRQEGGIAVLHFHYLIADAGGVRCAEEIHRLALAPRERMEAHFRAAGFECRYEPEGLSGRGLWIART